MQVAQDVPPIFLEKTANEIEKKITLSFFLCLRGVMKRSEENTRFQTFPIFAIKQT